MKKLITIFLCATCISVSAIAQSGVRIGSLEFIVRKAERDSVVQVFAEEDPCPPCPSENETQPKPKPKFTPYRYTNFFAGAGAIYPDYGSDYYTVLGGKSFNIDAGWIHCNMITGWFAIGGTLQYSFYNYKLRDAASEPKFAEEIIGMDFADEDIRKQVYRSHNIAASAFTRIYLRPDWRKRTRSGMFIDLGVQGDFVPNKFCMLNTHSEGKKRYHDDYAFNAFNASVIARLGFSSDWSIFARYRFTEAFNSKVLPMDLPPLTIGIQLSNW